MADTPWHAYTNDSIQTAFDGMPEPAGEPAMSVLWVLTDGLISQFQGHGFGWWNFKIAVLIGVRSFSIMVIIIGKHWLSDFQIFQGNLVNKKIVT